MKPLEYICILVLLSSPYLVGALIVAFWSPAGGALVAIGALVGLAWVLSMARAAKDN